MTARIKGLGKLVLKALKLAGRIRGGEKHGKKKRREREKKDEERGRGREHGRRGSQKIPKYFS